MIASNLHRLKVQKGRLRTTSYAGLPLIAEVAHHAGLIPALNSIAGLWQRDGRYKTADYILGLAMTLIAGGEGLDDTRLLRNDPGIKQLVFPDLPAANSFGRFLRRFGHRALHQMGELVADQARAAIKPGQTVTLDIDSTTVESDKEQAQMTYKGFSGYNPLLAWLAEPNVFMAGLFRDGNASPQSHLLSLVKYCRRRLQGITLRLRSDSAGYHVDLMRYSYEHDIEFAIAAPINAGIREVIEEIPRKAWQLVVEGEHSFLLAETVYAPVGSGTGVGLRLPAFRLIVKKYLRAQLELFKDPIDHHAIVTSLPESMRALDVLRYYDQRGTAEKMIAELKNGYGLDKLPCASLSANAAFFQTVLLAYNLVQRFKQIALPAAWRGFCVKNLRFRLLCQAAIIVRHARSIIVKLPGAFPFFREFENARWGVLAPTAAT